MTVEHTHTVKTYVLYQIFYKWLAYMEQNKKIIQENLLPVL